MSRTVIDVAATCRNLREMIEDQKYTPMEVQHALGLDSVQSVYKWYSPNNRTIPSLDSLVQISDLLGCAIEDILVVKNENLTRQKNTMICKKCGSLIEEPSRVRLSRTIITLGAYYQRVDTSFGKQPIEWIPLEWRDDGTVLVISREVLDCKEYEDDLHDWRQTWEDCSLRRWLNEEFLEEAFSSEEKEKILLAKNVNNTCEEYDTPCGNDTYDRVFLLSAEEVEKYCRLKDYYCNSACQATKYARGRGVRVSREYTCEWWLRTPGASMYGAPPNAVYVRGDGRIVRHGENMEFTKGVRPAMILDAKKL